MSGAKPQHLLLVYDGDCPLCRGIVNALVRARLVPPERIRAFQDLEGELSERVWNAGIRNEIAVLDEVSGAIRSGVDGLLWIASESWARPLAALATLPPLRVLARVVYRTVAYNRHLLAPKDPARVRCACDAEFHLGYRLALLVPSAVFVLAVAIAFARTLEPDAGGVSPRAWRIPIVLLGSWCAAAFAANRLPRERAFDWYGHLAVTAVLGAIALLPAVLLASRLEGPSLRAVQAGAGVVAAAAVGRSLVRRLRRIDHGPRSTFALIAVLAGTSPFVFLPLTS